MQKISVHVSPEFRKKTTSAVFSIILFLLVYILMIAIALALTALCIVGAIGLATLFFNFAIIMLSIGLASMGFFLLFFLFKFLFKRNKIDRSHLVELDLNIQPELKKIISEIVDKVGTQFPKRVYFSNEVNAAVFYDSSLLSMFFPVRKNLQVGLGLVNALTQEEFKAVLAHEFGHFSQRSMKLGSYVYYVNQVIYNLLYENDSYDNLASKWANLSGYFYIFVVVAIKMVQGAQWILRGMYGFVNQNYQALSREMEFHADEIAAQISGVNPIASSFYKVNHADNALQQVFRHYNSMIADNLQSPNAYRDQRFVLGFMNKNKEENFQNIRSEIVIKDQWASHPTDEERIARLYSLTSFMGDDQSGPASLYFSDFSKLEEKLTEKLFESVQFNGEVRSVTEEDFQKKYENEFFYYSFPKQFKGYYDFKNPIAFDLKEVEKESKVFSLEDLFSNEVISLVFEELSIEMDLNTIRDISNGNNNVKSFDFKGKKYTRKDVFGVQKELESRIMVINSRILQNDKWIFAFFLQLEKEKCRTPLLERYYQDLYEFDGEFKENSKLIQELNAQLVFTTYTTPIEKIRSNFREIAELEKILKSKIRKILEDARFETEIPLNVRDIFELYISKEWEYFGQQQYFQENLNTFLSSLQEFSNLQSRISFVMKKGLLEYKVSLLP